MRISLARGSFRTGNGRGVPRLRSAEIADRTAYPDIPVGAYGPPGSAWDRLGPDKFFSPRRMEEKSPVWNCGRRVAWAPPVGARGTTVIAARCPYLFGKRVPDRPGLSRLVPRCPAWSHIEFFLGRCGTGAVMHPGIRCRDEARCPCLFQAAAERIRTEGRWGEGFFHGFSCHFSATRD
jgi:hypothetical protein